MGGRVRGQGDGKTRSGRADESDLVPDKAERKGGEDFGGVVEASSLEKAKVTLNGLLRIR